MRSGRHFLQIPGPSPVPDRVLRAMDMPVIDHRSAEFGQLGRTDLGGCQKIFQTSGPVVIFPSSGTGAWEAVIVNTLSPGDKVLMVETGHFATLWRQMAARWGIDVEFIPGDWRRGADPAEIEARLARDTSHVFKAVMVVHNETSTGATSRIGDIRAVMDRVGHPALLMVDTISSLGSVDYRHDEWKVDVSVSCSQKGFMLPPGLGFNAISDKARAAAKTNRMPRSYWDWEEMRSRMPGFFHAGHNLLYGLREGRDVARRGSTGVGTPSAVGSDACCRQPLGPQSALQEPRTFLLTAALMPPGRRRSVPPGGSDNLKRAARIRLSRWLAGVPHWSSRNANHRSRR